MGTIETPSQWSGAAHERSEAEVSSTSVGSKSISSTGAPTALTRFEAQHNVSVDLPGAQLASDMVNSSMFGVTTLFSDSGFYIS